MYDLVLIGLFFIKRDRNGDMILIVFSFNAKFAIQTFNQTFLKLQKEENMKRKPPFDVGSIL